MNKERHRDQAERSSTRATDEASQDRSGNGNEVGEAQDAEDVLLLDGDAQLMLDGNDAASGNGNGHSANSANRHDTNVYTHVDEAQRSTIVLPKRKRRTYSATAVEKVAIAPEETVVITPTSVAGTPTKPMPPAPAPEPERVNLPARAQRKTQPVQAIAPLILEAPVETVVQETPRTGWRPQFSLESALWFSFLVLTLVTRFWDLSNRGIHHDESLHSVYGNYLYIGNGYTHDPMMHGPLQFHLIAFMYWLFTPNEATARFASAFCGVWVVMSPFFLRRQMGRVPALLATLLLFISPSILYFSRMAREDSIFSATEMLMIVGLWRFISTRRPADFYIFCAGLSLMFTIKETAYLTMAVLGLMFALLFVVQSGYAIMGAVGAYAAAMAGWLLYVKANTIVLDKDGKVLSGWMQPLPNIPGTNPNYDIIVNFARDLLTNPLILVSALLTVLMIGAVIALFRMQRNRMAHSPSATGIPVRQRSRVVADGASNGTMIQRRVVRGNGAEATVVAAEASEVAEAPAATAETPLYIEGDPDAASELWDTRRIDPKPGTLLSHYQPGSLPHLIGSLFSRPSVLLIGFAIAATIFTTLYTVFFTDMPRGLASGLFASLGYWMAQQDVARGGQPWYYYLLILPLYEPIAVFFSLAGTIFFASKGVRWLMRRRADNRFAETPQRLGAFNVDRPVPFASFGALMPLFLVWWIFGAVAVYSWAGEKMPWLMVHMVRPASLLSAVFIGMLLTSLLRRRQERLAAAGVPIANYSAPAQERVVPLNGVRVPTSNGSNGSNGSRNRRAAPARVATTAVARKQEAPWVSWNRPGSRFPSLSFLTLFVVFAFCYGMALNTLMDKAKQPEGYTNWGLSWFWPSLMAALVVAYAVWLGPGRALRYLGLGILSVFLLYQVRSAVMLSYFQPDVPKEMASYVQTSPDVTRSMKELTDFSVATTGGKNAKVIYDSFTSWPFSWYLRDFKNTSFKGDAVPSPEADVSVMFLDYSTSNNHPELLKDYTVQRYAMRWWFPEEWYKNDLMSGLPAGQDYKSAPVSTSAGVLTIKLGDTFTKPDNQATLWNYLMFREPAKPLGSQDMNVYLRKDIAQMYHYLQYQPMPGDDLPLAYQELPAPLESPRPIPNNSLR